MTDRTPLHDWHAARGGRMVDFAGWSMPVVYSSIVDEHRATRNAVGLFDVSHMGRIDFLGDGAAAFLDGLTTRRVADMRPGEVRYSLLCNAQGGILDDVLVYCHARGEGDPTADGPRESETAATPEPLAGADPRAEGPLTRFSMVVNASNRAKILAWLDENHEDVPALWVKLYKKGSGRVNMTWPESVDAALCFGWIDGIAKRLDAERSAQRFTPRRARSHWTELNKERARRLIAAGLMTDAGRAVLPDLDVASFRIADDILAAL